ncbi:DUF6380 family protein [Streptomyces luteogriseus]|uniref:DUF6380 family protein n=1 Tax=Streptomyces luteogriseus TaxID=68233 RepID=UPI0037ADB2AE
MTAQSLGGRSAVRGTAPHVPQARPDTEPVHAPVRRRERGAGVDGQPGCRPHAIPAAGRGHHAPPAQAVADNRRATLRRGAASLTETAGRAPFGRHAPAMGEGAR